MRFKIWQGVVILGAAFIMLVFSLFGAQEGQQMCVPPPSAADVPPVTEENNLIRVPEGGIVFGPKNFVLRSNAGNTYQREFRIIRPRGTFWLQLTNGQDGENLVETATITLNGQVVVAQSDFNQPPVFGFGKDIVLQEDNALVVELRGAKGTSITLTVRRAFLNPTVSNDANDLRGANHLDSIVLWWSSEDRATEYIFFRSESIDGPFVEVFRLPAGLSAEFPANAQDITTDARIKTLCYRMEARDLKAKTVRTYEPVCVPPWKDDVSASSQLNPTVSNAADDLSGSNEINAITLWWEREPKATEYVFFRSESVDGPFAEVFRAPAGLEFSTNASDENPDARIKTLCYRMEARDLRGETVRTYEPVCVPPWLDDVVEDPAGGLIIVNEILVNLAEDVPVSVLDSILNEVNGTIVGYIDITNEYKIRIEATTVQELNDAIATIEALNVGGVEIVSKNGLVYPD